MQRSLLDAVARNVRLVTVQKGSTVMREGGSGDHMFIIATGTCIVIKADSALFIYSLAQQLHFGASCTVLAPYCQGATQCAPQYSAQQCAEKGRKRALRSLTVGQSFGELALQEAGGKRAATVTASEDCDLLALDGFEYRTVLAQHHRQELDRRVRTIYSIYIPFKQ